MHGGGGEGQAGEVVVATAGRGDAALGVVCDGDGLLLIIPADTTEHRHRPGGGGDDGSGEILWDGSPRCAPRDMGVLCYNLGGEIVRRE